jgi:hypothetical protein
VWYPRSWSEVNALIHDQAVETASLDFKKSVTRNEEIAKDVAAMTLNGGVLIYGIDEDETTTLAREITPVEVKGLETRFRQVVGSHISPVPHVDTEFIPKPDEPTEGVFVVVVPPSPVAPHQVAGRYPCRRGTTTGYLEEAEIERLYRQRHESEEEPLGAVELLAVQFVEIWPELRRPGAGELRLIVKPRTTEVRHPAGPWQASHLQEALRLAADRQRHRFNNISLVRCFNALSQWEPHGVAGWAAGKNAQLGSSRSDGQRFGATLAYPARLSFQANWGLHVVDANDELRYTSAREIDVARELTAMLATAGEYFTDIQGAGLLVAGLKLHGFSDAISQLGTETGRMSELSGAHDGVNTATDTSALELRDIPELGAQRLMENWLPPFYMVDGKKLDQYGNSIDLFDLIVNEIGAGAPPTL